MAGRFMRATDGRSRRCERCGKVLKVKRNETLGFVMAEHIAQGCDGQ